MQFFNDPLARSPRLERVTGKLNSPGDSWLDELKAEIEARRQAEAELQYRRDAMVARLMMELNRVHCVELLEEMNRELLNREGRVEPVYTDRHELCFSWPVPGGRNQITVGTDFDPSNGQVFLVVTGNEVQRMPVDESQLKKALIRAFREPMFNVYRW
jgi:hypothetical protein